MTTYQHSTCNNLPCPPSLTLTLILFPYLFCPSPPQAAFRTDLSVLLDQVGTGKESLSFMKRRIRRLAQQWATAANRLDAKLEQRWRDQKKVIESAKMHSVIHGQAVQHGNIGTDSVHYIL